jgi:hypothetical protein
MGEPDVHPGIRELASGNQHWENATKNLSW